MSVKNFLDKEASFASLFAISSAIIFLVVGPILYFNLTEEKVPLLAPKFGEIVEVEHFFYGKCTTALIKCAIFGDCFECRPSLYLKCQTPTKRGSSELYIETDSVYLFFDRYKNGTCQEYRDFKVTKRNL